MDRGCKACYYENLAVLCSKNRKNELRQCCCIATFNKVMRFVCVCGSFYIFFRFVGNGGSEAQFRCKLSAKIYRNNGRDHNIHNGSRKLFADILRLYSTHNTRFIVSFSASQKKRPSSEECHFVADAWWPHANYYSFQIANPNNKINLFQSTVRTSRRVEQIMIAENYLCMLPDVSLGGLKWNVLLLASLLIDNARSRLCTHTH